ncbi:crooked neck-like protein 1 [Sycon ciliatum]|uniref:crooked neck-like protein 1 n=1 Tax=Sycon ciliatum TaxID=27933 RepID=UPI0020AD11AF|eukprot:scpid61715/ scgid29582/ Crooked neck-like protein 1; Crooked neck homolog
MATKMGKVKNKAPAEMQVTAEQLLREAKERQLEVVPAPPKQKISDPEELAEYRLRKRKAFEDEIRKNRVLVSNWIKYAQWEDSQQELERARSVYERALDVAHRNVTVWLKYAEMEMKRKQIQHARNIWDRAVTVMPRANQFWYKYTYMEEMLGNVAGARQVFGRWMQWEPDEQAWFSYLKMELRYKEVPRARQIYEHFVMVHPDVKNWIRYGRFELQHGNVSSARTVFERAVDFFGDDHLEEQLYVAFAKFEEQQKEYERARVIYKYALDRIPKQEAQDLFNQYSRFEKRFGDRRGVETVVVSKRRFQYEEEVKANPCNYDAWFDLLRLTEEDSDEDAVRETYERAIANIPPSAEKRHWRRYIYLWIFYAMYEELVAEDVDRARQVYKACLGIIPHQQFTFAKIWLMAAELEVRQRDLPAARRLLGNAIGRCPKDKLFHSYIEIELQLREFDRCRMLFEKFLEYNSANCTTWIRFAEMETLLGDATRARSIFELAIEQTLLDMPEVLWKAYIDFEIAQDEPENARQLYERLLERTQHVKVWLAFAAFEARQSAESARDIFRRAEKSARSSGGEAEEQVMILEAWSKFEQEHGDPETQAAITKRLPKKIKKRRENGEEYFDYIFPEDRDANPNFKLLQMAHMWKQGQ